MFFSGILSAICANTGKYFYKSNIKYLSTNVHYYFKMQNYDWRGLYIFRGVIQISQSLSFSIFLLSKLYVKN